MSNAGEDAVIAHAARADQGDALPCPFCGGTPTVFRFKDYGYTRIRILCKHCGISGSYYHAHEGDLARAQWNRRVTPAAEGATGGSSLEEIRRVLTEISEESGTDYLAAYKFQRKARALLSRLSQPADEAKATAPECSRCGAALTCLCPKCDQGKIVGGPKPMARQPIVIEDDEAKATAPEEAGGYAEFPYQECAPSTAQEAACSAAVREGRPAPAASNAHGELALSRDEVEALRHEIAQRDYTYNFVGLDALCVTALAAHDWKARAEKAEAERDAAVKALEPLLSKPTAELKAAAERLWNEDQDKADEFIRRNEAPPADLLHRIEIHHWACKAFDAPALIRSALQEKP